jgi:hypothetical protein
MARTLDELKSLGVNSIAIHPYAQIQNDGHVRFRASDNFRHISVPLDWARERGLSVMLIPHIAYWGTKFLWRGDINFQTTGEWDRFFNDYETWIVQMAQVAEAHGAATFCIGLEFTYAQKFDARWRKIIAAVRQVYHGKLTYGGNWDSFQEVTFWDALDYIGVLAYFPLTKSVNPSEAEIAAALPRRARESHKGSNGRVLVVGGGSGMPGAVRLAGSASLRAGAGLVTVAGAEDNLLAVTGANPEFIYLPVSSLTNLEEAIRTASVLAIGPGLGTGDWAQKLWAQALRARPARPAPYWSWMTCTGRARMRSTCWPRC